jgi:putative transposase
MVELAKPGQVALTDWPVPKPPDWVSFANQALIAKELEDLRVSAQKGRPCGSDRWKMSMAERLGLEFTLRHRGRPRKENITIGLIPFSMAGNFLAPSGN